MVSISGNTTSEPLSRYMQRRVQLYQSLEGAWSKTLNRPTDILDAISLSALDVAEIKVAARAVMAIYSELAALLKQLPRSALQRIGIPATLSGLVDTPSSIDDLLLARLDFVATERGLKLLDCNLDAPGLLVETFEINRLVCRELNLVDPNHACRNVLKSVFADAVLSASRFIERPLKKCKIAIVYHQGFCRDADSAEFILGILNNSNILCKLLAVDELVFDDDGVYDDKGEKIDILIRTCPLEDLFKIRSRCRIATDRVLDANTLCEFILNKNFVIINTPLAAILENKMMQAFIWKLYEENIAFTRSVREFIEQYMLPTFFSPDGFEVKYIAKPAFGRGGSSIAVVGKTGRVLEIGRTRHNDDNPYVYQTYVKPPTVKIMTELGEKTLRFILSAWVIDRREIGICWRAGEGITDAAWWIAPVYLSATTGCD